MKFYKVPFISAIFVFIVSLFSWYFLGHLRSEQSSERDKSITLQSADMQAKVSAMVLEKQQATLAIAVAMANNKTLVNDIATNKISDTYCKTLMADLSRTSPYKNLWLQIVDTEYRSIYKSWDPLKGDRAGEPREYARVMEFQRPLYTISAGAYDLVIKAMVPVVVNGKSIGVVEVLSHFNSISQKLKEFDIESVVVLKKDLSHSLIYPLTNIFIGEYYVANKDAMPGYLEQIRKDGVENYFNPFYKIQNNTLVVSHKLEDMNNKEIAYVVMFKPLSSIPAAEIDFGMFEILVVVLIVSIILATLGGNYIHCKLHNQKKYYHNIMDASSNIVVVESKDAMLDANKTFFTYFDTFATVDQFTSIHHSISDFFVEQDGYMARSMRGKWWIDELLSNPQNNKVKIAIGDKDYYFTVFVSCISEEEQRYSAIFSDITKEELYQKELEHATVTDALTQVKNRHYYNSQIRKECATANRYFYPLSLVVFDIDHFKKINDSHGHDVGDSVLVEYTRLVSMYLRESDVFCRIGGEEFVLILPHVTKSDAYKIADKIRTRVQEYKKIVPVTMSFGVTEYHKSEDVESLFKRADMALYEAKNNGRNKVVVR